jgi:hypothetical protein
VFSFAQLLFIAHPWLGGSATFAHGKRAIFICVCRFGNSGVSWW